MKLIVAVDSRWGIGKNGDLLLSIPDDMQYYRATTRGKVVVMGYTTLLSLPKSKPQPGRLNLVLADIEGLRVSGAVVCRSMEQLLRMIGNFEPGDVFDIGGGSMYRQLLPYCSAAHITKMRFDGGADTFIPNLDDLPEWSVSDETELKEYDGVCYSFVEYRNAQPKELPSAAQRSPAMCAYFRKKEQVTFDYIDDADFRAELTALLHAYYYPLENGFSAADVDAFLNESDTSFEQYLRNIRAIAAPEDFDALVAKYNPDSSKKTVKIRVEKEQLPAFEEAPTVENFVI